MPHTMCDMQPVATTAKHHGTMCDMCGRVHEYTDVPPTQAQGVPCSWLLPLLCTAAHAVSNMLCITVHALATQRRA